MSKYKLIVRHKFREKYAMNTQFPAVVLKHIATYAIGGGENNAWMSGKQDCFSMNGTGTDKNAAASPRCGSVSANL